MTFARTRLAWTLALANGALFVGGCATNIKTAIGPNNSHIITCGNGMSSCINKAAKICGDDGYTILEGVSRSKLLGGSSSSYRAVSEMGELTVKCGLPEDEEEVQPEVEYKLPERTDEPIEVPEPAVTTLGAVCTPGSTLACVGPGACQGGQVCLDNGRGYGPCDCGGAKPESSDDKPQEGGAKDSRPKTIIQDSPGQDGGGAPVVPGAAPAPTPLSK